MAVALLNPSVISEDIMEDALRLSHLSYNKWCGSLEDKETQLVRSGPNRAFTSKIRSLNIQPFCLIAIMR